MIRMVGGTFGVAVMGAIIATLGRQRLATLLPHASSAKRASLVNALGSGSGTGHSSLPAAIQRATSDTFVYSLSHALAIAGGFALVGALLAWVLIIPRSAAERERLEEPAREPAQPGIRAGERPARSRTRRDAPQRARPTSA